MSGNSSDERNPSLVALADGGFALAYEFRLVPSPTDTSTFLERCSIDGTVRPSASTHGVSYIDTFVSGQTNVHSAIT